MPIKPEHLAALVALIVVVIVLMVAGAWIDRSLFREQVESVVEAPANQIDLGEHGIVLHRDPNGRTDNKPPPAPAGHTPVRDVEVDVLPPPVEVTCSDGTVVTKECPVVTVGFRLLRVDADGTYRVQGYSADGELLGGIDVPKAMAMVPKQHRYFVGAAVFSDDARQLEVGHTFGRVDAALLVHKADSDVTTGLGARLRF